jgi:hypothetical protein
VRETKLVGGKILTETALKYAHVAARTQVTNAYLKTNTTDAK